MKPGVYITDQGLLFAGETQDGGLVVVQVPLDLAGLEAAGRRILDHVYAARQAQREAAVAGEKPRVAKLNGGNAAWN
jgi:hypothetical protein